MRVQRCRQHKIENVVGYLPQELEDEVKCVMKAAYRLSAADGIARLQAQAQWLEKPYPSAAASLREGLEETFTINRRVGYNVICRRRSGGVWGRRISSRVPTPGCVGILRCRRARGV